MNKIYIYRIHPNYWTCVLEDKRHDFYLLQERFYSRDGALNATNTIDPNDPDVFAEYEWELSSSVVEDNLHTIENNQLSLFQMY